ncbi:MAG: threonine synthase, partial [Spirochaetaceae bacterium]|nr:threonine synthase [Spirochaetaceae bacterium]
MIYRDTRDASISADFRTAVMSGMNPESGGLYIPSEFPRLPASFLRKTPAPSFRDIAFETVKPYVNGEISDAELQSIIVDAYPFNPQIT